MSGTAPPAAFWAEPGALTALPAGFAAGERLPATPDGLRELLHGLVIHCDLLHLYGLPAEADPPAEIHLRPATELLAALRARADLPLTVPRPPERRLRGSCRHFAVLLCALLRAQGTPSRVRAGFAGYFEPGQWEDHWIVEYATTQDGGWRRADAELDPVEVREYHITFDPGDLPADAFLTGAQAWRRHRRGEVDASRFGFADDRGAHLIAGSVLRDLAALNKNEMLPWDYWGLLDDWERGRVPIDPGYVDEIAEVVDADDPAGIREVFRRPELVVPDDPELIRRDR